MWNLVWPRLTQMWTSVLLGFMWLLLFGGAQATPLPDEDRSNSVAPAIHWEPSGPYGGDARRLAFDPQDPDIHYLGTSDGQVFRSIDGGQAWQLLRPGFPQRGFSIQSLFVDRRSSQRLFLGGWTVRGENKNGAYVSEDGGLNWRPVPALQGMAIRALVQSPSEPEIFVAGALDAVYRSEDGGKTWHRISFEHPEFQNIESVAVDPEDPNVIYVGTWHLPWKTIDGGKSWKLIGSSAVGMVDDSDIFSIVVDYSNASVVYMSACSGIYRSENAGQNWTKIQGIPSSSRRTQVIVQHPTEPSLLYAGTTQGLWKSSDQGRRWVLVTDRRLVVNDISIHAGRSNVVMLATAQGVLLSENGDKFSPSNQGFSHLSISALHRDVEKPTRLYASVLSAGSGTGLYVSDDSGQSWQEFGEGLRGVDVYSLLQIPSSPDIIYAGTNQGLYKSTDRGFTWAAVNSTRPRKQKARRGSRKHAAKSVTSSSRKSGTFNPKAKVLALVSRNGSNTILLMTESSLHQGDFKAGKWETLYESNGEERLLCVSTSRSNSERIYLGSNQGLKISQDAGENWESLAVAGMSYPVQALAEDPSRPDIFYMGTQFGLYRWSRTPEGLIWNRLGRGLPPISVSAIVINRDLSDELVVGDQRFGGLYRSLNRGENWERIDSGFASPRVSVLHFDGDSTPSLLVGTLNGGIYVGN